MDVKVFDLGLTDFQDAWQFQKETFAAVENRVFDSALIFCRHNPVITLGRASHRENILATQEQLIAQGIDICQIERGGDVTYHGPGQLTVYPVINLNCVKKDIHWFIRQLEEVIIGSLSDFGIISQRRPGLTGVWIGERKIASIGISIRRWISFHGFTINVKRDDLANFKLIRPCGMDIEMIALDEAIGKDIAIEKVQLVLIERLRDTLSFNFKDVPRLGSRTSLVKEEVAR